jgi:hypothetical protein
MDIALRSVGGFLFIIVVLVVWRIWKPISLRRER